MTDFSEKYKVSEALLDRFVFAGQSEVPPRAVLCTPRGARLWLNHRNISLYTLVTTSSFKPQRSLTSLFLHLSFRDTPHILRRYRVSTPLILLSFFFYLVQCSLPYISVEIKTPLRIAKSAYREALEVS
ncbi:hypothetical protein EVAR_31963_1 [Eumeta japonica]|uniref:Uncharacterized protein n=1 Tax=Eumeta variegata TaxID=151549 RepID=A0A4C1VTJ7_EUMVA|nr:hypothetical protein EVAR_31963_1 [Eumeta japonica]